MALPWKPLPPNPELEALLKRSAEIVAAMTPAQKAEMHLRQSISYVRGEMGIEHPDWSEEKLNELIERMPQAWALAEIDRLRAAATRWEPLAKALFEIEHDPKITDQGWFDFQGKAQLILRKIAQQG